MGHIGSCVKKIADIRFEGIPLRRARTDIVKAVVLDRGSFWLTCKGQILTTSELRRGICVCGTSSDYVGIKALRCLGVITADEAKQHGKQHVENDVNIARYHAANAELSKLTEIGIKLTQKQKRQLEEARAKGDFNTLPRYMKQKTGETPA